MWNYIDPELEYLLGQPLDWYTSEQGDTLQDLLKGWHPWGQ